MKQGDRVRNVRTGQLGTVVDSEFLMNENDTEPVAEAVLVEFDGDPVLCRMLATELERIDVNASADAMVNNRMRRIIEGRPTNFT